MKYGERLRAARDHKGWSQEVLAKMSGVGQGSISKIERGDQQVSAFDIELADALDVNALWLKSGVKKHEPVWVTNPGADELVNETGIELGNTSIGPESKGFLPIISWVTAGDWCCNEGQDDFESKEKPIPCPAPHGLRSYILRVKGISMEPEYRDGEMIFVDPDRQPIHNSDVVVKISSSNEATFKRLQIEGDNRYLIALNPATPNPVIPLDEEVIICGVVIFAGNFKG